MLDDPAAARAAHSQQHVANGLIAASHVVAVEFATIAAANNYGR